MANAARCDILDLFESADHAILRRLTGLIADHVICNTKKARSEYEAISNSIRLRFKQLDEIVANVSESSGKKVALQRYKKGQARILSRLDILDRFPPSGLKFVVDLRRLKGELRVLVNLVDAHIMNTMIPRVRKEDVEALGA